LKMNGNDRLEFRAQGSKLKLDFIFNIHTLNFMLFSISTKNL